MKMFFLILAAGFTLTTSFAQQEMDPSGRFDLRVNAGSTFTFVPDFNNRMLMARDGLIIPGFIHPSNSVSLSTAVASSSSESSVGWYAEAEGYYTLPRNFSLSIGAGIKKMRFDYTSNVSYFAGMDALVSVTMDDLTRRFGETDLLYLSITPINISRHLLHNRLAIQAGPVLNWVLKEKTTNTVLLYDTQEALMINKPDQAYFDTVGDTNSMIVGANLHVSYRVVKPVSISVSAQHYFNSMYEDKAYGLDVEKINPLVLQAGLSVSPFAF